MQQYTPNIGQLCAVGARRDCIHFAVAPVVASIELRPGCRVGLDEVGHAEISETRHCIGIVDPFLTENVQEGQTFWLFLYPNSITGLRHVWQHPSFITKAPTQGE